MKILIVNKHILDEIGGSEIQCDMIARYLTKYGHDVIYGAVKSKRKKYPSSYPVIPLKDLNLFSLWHLISRVKPDVIYWRYNKKSLLAAGVAANFHHCKLVFGISHINDTQKWSFKASGGLKKLDQLITSRINYMGYRLVDGVVSLRQDLMEAVPPYERIQKAFIRNSMESHCSGSFNWKRPYVVWVATIKKPKNPELFVEAAERLAYRPVDFIMIGKIQHSSYNYLTQKENLPDNFYYLGTRSLYQVNAVLKNALFLAHTCAHEGFSNIFIQTWLQEKPTVSLFFDPDGFIERHQVGYLSGSFDPFCKDIERLIQDGALRKEMGTRARRIAEELFEPEVNMRKYEAFFESIVGKKGR